MSSFVRSYGQVALAIRGPLIQVSVGIPETWSIALRRRGLVVPPAVVGEALIDTGSTVSGIDQRVLDELGLPPVDSRSIATPLGTAEQTAHPAQMAFPAVGLPDLTSDDWVALDLERHTGAIALIGRNILAHWTMTYEGLSGTVTIDA